MMAFMICAGCGNSTNVEPCASCGEGPRLGGYALVRALGHGTTGTTWLALDAAGGEVALKELAIHGEAKARELLVREVRVLRELNHPAIPRYLADFPWGTGRRRVHCVVQEYVPGRTLAEELGDRRFTVEDVLDVLERILEPLAYMHARSPPVVHRDLKPANVILRPDGRVALVDFGAVRDAWKGTLGGSTVAGTFGYMAPEQFHGDASPATDVYGAAALAVALLARKDPSALLDRQGGLNWRGFARVPPPIAALLEQMLDADPAHRPCDATSARSLVQTIRARGWAEPPRVPQAVPSPPPPLKGPVAKVAERTVVEDPRIFLLAAPERTAMYRVPVSWPQWSAALIGGLLVGGLGVGVLGPLLANSPHPIAAPALPLPQYTLLPTPLGAGVTASPHVLLWYQERVTDPGVQSCIVGSSAPGDLVLEPDGRAAFVAARRDVQVGVVDRWSARTPVEVCLDDALRHVPTTLVPSMRVPIEFPVVLGHFTWNDRVGTAWLDGVQADGKLLLNGPVSFVHGEHRDFLFQGVPTEVSAPAGAYATLVHGVMGHVFVAPGRSCEYTWDAVGGWYGGCL